MNQKAEKKEQKLCFSFNKRLIRWMNHQIDCNKSNEWNWLLKSIESDAVDVRVRETPAGDGVGRLVPGRPHQRHPPAAHLLSAVPPLPALFPAGARPLPRQTARVARDGRQTGLAPHARTAHQFQIARKTLKNLISSSLISNLWSLTYCGIVIHVLFNVSTFFFSSFYSLFWRLFLVIEP